MLAKQIRAQLTSWSQRDPSVRFTRVPNASHIANWTRPISPNAEIAGFLGWWCPVGGEPARWPR